MIVFSSCMLSSILYTLSCLKVLGDEDDVLDPEHRTDGPGLRTLALWARYCVCVAACHHHMSRGGLINRTSSHDELAKWSLTKHLIITANCSIHYRLIGEPHEGLCYMGAAALVNADTWARSASLHICNMWKKNIWRERKTKPQAKIKWHTYQWAGYNVITARICRQRRKQWWEGCRTHKISESSKNKMNIRSPVSVCRVFNKPNAYASPWSTNPLSFNIRNVRQYSSPALFVFAFL